MTPAVIVRSIWTTRRGFGMVIAALMLAIVLLLYSIVASYPHQVVRYGSTVIAPERLSYCPGDVMRYPVHVSVDAAHLPTVLHVVEGWYSEQRGVIPYETVSNYDVPLVRPADLDTTAVRIIPDLPPGVYWLDRVAVDGKTTGYTVGPVVVGECGE